MCNCGVKQEQRKRIVGGTEVDIKSAPWQVSLQWKNSNRNNDNNDWQHICGGSIIGYKTVLTATHCVDQKLASDLRIVVGSQDLIESDEESARLDQCAGFCNCAIMLAAYFPV